jgi:molybdopterin synthase sulfur carrier subunit
MATVYIPPLLRDLTDGQDTVTVAGATVAEIIARLEAAYPGVRARLCEAERLRPGLAVAVDGQLSSLGLLQPVTPGSEVHFVPAIAGGGA